MKKIRNPVAKHARVNRAATHTDRRKVMKTQGPDEEEFEMQLEEDCLTCPACGNSLYAQEGYIGTLGIFTYYRCPQCGWDFTE